MRLCADFFIMDARQLAQALIGKLLCREIDDEIIKLRITQTECYFGEEDTACHAHKGKTERTKVMYERGGLAYIYLCYGIHSLFNIVAGEQGHPEAVLIRGISGYNGPGKLTKALKIDRSLNWEDLAISQKLYLEDDGFTCPIKAGKRIGINYATEEYREILWRFTMQYPCS